MTNRFVTDKQMAYIFLVGSIALGLGLVPTILNPDSFVPLYSSLPILITLSIYAIVFFCKKQAVSGAGLLLQTLAWGFVAVFRHG